MGAASNSLKLVITKFLAIIFAWSFQVMGVGGVLLLWICFSGFRFDTHDP
jgi:hypothetical protein